MLSATYYAQKYAGIIYRQVPTIACMHKIIMLKVGVKFIYKDPKDAHLKLTVETHVATYPKIYNS